MKTFSITSISITRIFCHAVAIAGLLWCILMAVNPKGAQSHVFSNVHTHFFDDFLTVRTCAAEGYFGTTLKPHDSCYPALGPIMALPFPKTETGGAAFTGLGALLFVLALSAMFPFRKMPVDFFIGCLLSPVMLHALDWGNQILYATAGTVLFMAWFNSNKTWQRRSAAIALAVATDLKITPVMLSFLYATEYVRATDPGKRKTVIKDAALFAVAAALLFFLPFSWYGGFNGFRQWLSNASANAKAYVGYGAWGIVPIGRTIRILLHVSFDVNQGWKGIGIERAISVSIGLACLIRAACLSFAGLRKNIPNSGESDCIPFYASIMFLLVGAILLIPGNMHVYTGLYLIPILAMQIKRTLTWFEALCWFLFLCPLQVPVGSGCINHPIANLAFLTLLSREFLPKPKFP